MLIRPFGVFVLSLQQGELKQPYQHMGNAPPTQRTRHNQPNRSDPIFPHVFAHYTAGVFEGLHLKACWWADQSKWTLKSAGSW